MATAEHKPLEIDWIADRAFKLGAYSPFGLIRNPAPSPEMLEKAVANKAYLFWLGAEAEVPFS